jgi:hypothetical protein
MEASVQRQAPAGLFPGNTQLIPIEDGAGWVQDVGGGVWTYWTREIFFFSLPEIEPRFFGRPYRSPVTAITELSRLHSSAVSNPDLHISGRCLAIYSGENEQVQLSCKSFIFLSTQIGPKLFHT